MSAATRRHLRTSCALAVGLVVGVLLLLGPLQRPAAAATTNATTWSVDNPIPPRLQWNENNGYCGETAFISAGLYYGQYLSQYDARAIASDDTPQYETDAQLLLGVNDQYAASQMHLTSSEWTPGTTSTTDDFLAWVKSEVIQGYPVAIGVYENQSLFYNTTKPNAGDPKYDHIVIVTGVTSHHPLTLPATYYADDELKFSDNGLWTGTTGTKPQYVFDYPFGTFQATRQAANTPTGNVYSLADTVRNYGIAITGVADPEPPDRARSGGHQCERRDTADRPPIQHPPRADAAHADRDVSGLHPGTAYDLYRYDDSPNSRPPAFQPTRGRCRLDDTVHRHRGELHHHPIGRLRRRGHLPGRSGRHRRHGRRPRCGLLGGRCRRRALRLR